MSLDAMPQAKGCNTKSGRVNGWLEKILGCHWVPSLLCLFTSGLKMFLSCTCEDSILALQVVLMKSGQSSVLAIDSLLMSGYGSVKVLNLHRIAVCTFLSNFKC